ncbi:hypothetical protein ScPMuIL_015726 [Solemya velum]
MEEQVIRSSDTTSCSKVPVPEASEQAAAYPHCANKCVYTQCTGRWMCHEIHYLEQVVDSATDVMFDHELELGGVLNNTVHGDATFKELLEILEQNIGRIDSHHTADTQHIAKRHQSYMKDSAGVFQDAESYMKNSKYLKKSRHKREAAHGSEHGGTSEVYHEITHTLHLGSLTILSVLVFETFLKVFAMGKKFLSHKLEVFDAFVIIVSWCLDVAFLEGFWSHPESEAANIMIFNLPWRVVRIVNSFVLVIQEKDQVQLKIVKQQYRGSVKRSQDMKMKIELYRIEIRNLHTLSRKRGASDREIQACAPEGKRRRSSLLPVLSRLASLSLLSAFSSTSELTKHNHSNDSSDEESVVDFRSIKNRRASSISDTLSVARTISTGSSVSTVHAPFTPTLSVDSMFNENPVFEEECPPNYIEVASSTKEKVSIIVLVENT